MNNGIADESLIEDYWRLYEEIRPFNRFKIAREFNSFINSLSPFVICFQNKKRVDGKSLILILKQIDTFMQTNLPNSLYKNYSTVPLLRYATEQHMLVAVAFSLLNETMLGCLPETKNECLHKYNFLVHAAQCLKDCGLHKEIEKRNSQFKRYNVIIKHKKGKIIEEDCHILISREELLRNYVTPYKNERQITINGFRPKPKAIERLIISSTLLKDNEIPNFKSKMQIGSELRFAEKCFPETNVFINNIHPEEVEILETTSYTDHFIKMIIAGIRSLQESDTLEQFIKEAKEGKVSENAFRQYFKNRFQGASLRADAEAQKGTGRIDLRVEGEAISAQIMEFKVWGNKDMRHIVSQVSEYLTDFEDSGHIVIVNPRKKDIVVDYKKLITASETNFVAGSWKVRKFRNSNFTYFQSKHRSGNKIKIIYHYFYRLYP